MKIIYLIPGCGISGGIAVVCQHANRLLKRGHQVYLLTETDENNLDWFPGQKVPVINLADYPEKVDALIATGWSTSFRVALLPAQKKFYFVQSDETRFHPEGSIAQQVTGMSYLFSFNYLTEARWIQKWLMDNFEHEAEIVPNGLDGDIFSPAQPLVPKGKKPRVLLEGAIGLPYKGMKEAFMAVSDLDVEIWCVSSFGRPEANWRCDRFFEQVPMTQMRNIYSSCDVMLKLSRVEGFFGPPMEMMACGGAVVVGRVTGYDEYIVDGYNALVVDPEDVLAAKAAVTRILSDSKLKNTLITNGLTTAKEWQWEPFIDRLEQYLQDVLMEKRGNPYPSSRQNVDKSISLIYKTIRASVPLSYIPEPSADGIDTKVESTDIVFSRLKQIRWLMRSVEYTYQNYQNLKLVKKKISKWIGAFKMS
jgi:glycosyltransferase involved in cell wall biosynthesis